MPSAAQWQRTLRGAGAFLFLGPGPLLAQLKPEHIASLPLDGVACALLCSPQAKVRRVAFLALKRAAVVCQAARRGAVARRAFRELLSLRNAAIACQRRGLGCAHDGNDRRGFGG